jgi:hypothetical protein
MTYIASPSSVRSNSTLIAFESFKVDITNERIFCKKDSGPGHNGRQLARRLDQSLFPIIAKRAVFEHLQWLR